jgi:hypothetical protein
MREEQVAGGGPEPPAARPAGTPDPDPPFYLFVRSCIDCGTTDLGSAYGVAARLALTPNWSCPECGGRSPRWLPLAEP